jgi:hypothetical protein
MKMASALAVFFGLTTSLVAQAPLQVTYGTTGVQTIAFQGQVLEDVGKNPSDAFHIFHMKSTDLKGNNKSDGQYGWGESNSGTTWDAATHTKTYKFDWGTIAVQFAQNGNNLDMTVTETNLANSGIIFDGADISPFALHFPSDPAQFYGYTQYAITTTGPGVSVADYGTGIVTSVLPDESEPMYVGWETQGANTYAPLMSGTGPDGLATFFPHNDRPVQPGQSFTYKVSLRFTPEGTPADASDAYKSFAAKYPNQLNWSDRRILGTVYLASSQESDNITQPAGYPTNPRRYFNDPSMDITTPAGMQILQNRILEQAFSNVTNARAMNAQGVVTWDIEGEQYPQSTSYVCSPDQVATVAPEMEATVIDKSSPYHGQKLDDAYFKIMSSAGLKLGVCLRPQVFTQGTAGTSSQVDLSGNAAIIKNLEAKARYANSRWGVTIFYVDTNVDPNGGTLDPAIYQQIGTDLPNFLFMPEESTPRYYAYTAPFYSFIFHSDVGTPASIYNAYPHAFGANLVNDADPVKLAQFKPQLIQSVARGDILMAHADYAQDNNATLAAMYKAAGSAVPAPVPVPAPPVPVAVPHVPPVPVPAPAPVPVPAPPVPVAVPPVAPAPVIVPTPAPLPCTPIPVPAVAPVPPPTPVPTPVVVPPAPTPTPPAPVATPPISNLSIVSPTPNQNVSGTITVTGKVNLNLDSAGSYLMVDGDEIGTDRVTSEPYTYDLDTTTLSNGSHVLQLWAHDTGDTTTLSGTVTVNVAN